MNYPKGKRSIFLDTSVTATKHKRPGYRRGLQPGRIAHPQIDPTKKAAALLASPSLPRVKFKT